MESKSQHVVVLGVSGSGKDTVASLLDGFNVKFSQPIKDSLSRYLDVPYFTLNKQEYRSSVPVPIEGLEHMSLDDLLVVSYHIFQAVDDSYFPTQVVDKVKHMESIHPLFVWTDMRTLVECKLFIENFPPERTIVIQLMHPTAQAKSSDLKMKAILEMFNDSLYDIITIRNDGTVDELDKNLFFLKRHLKESLEFA